MEHALGFLISRDAERVQTASFEVPSACSAICFYHNIPDRMALLVNMVIEDPDKRVRFQKQLGYSEKVIGLGEHYYDTTIGGIPGIIESGRWTIKIYLNLEYVKNYIGKQKLSFTVVVTDSVPLIEEHLGEEIWADLDFNYTGFDFGKVYKKGRRWYKGDFHAHTRLSDGKETPERVTEKAHIMNLDFYTATEHNMMHTGWPKTDVLVLPGIEITTAIGHANLFGLQKRPKFMDDVLGIDDKEALGEIWRKIEIACQDEKWLFSINHPFLYLWKWEYFDLPLEYISCLEIINDPTYAAVQEAHAAEANMFAIQMADILWDDGYRICAIGGSDSHNRSNETYEGATEPSIAGDPATWLYMEDLCASNVYEALRNCSVYVTRYIEEMEIALYADGKNISPGARINGDVRSIEWEISVKSESRVPHLFALINGQRCELMLKSDGKESYVGSGLLEIPDGEYCWIRFGAESAQKEFMMYANPITRGKRSHNLYTFGDAKAALGI